MDGDQFNELLAYMKIVALNTTALLFQQSRQTPLTPEETNYCQTELLKAAQGLKDGAAGPRFVWPPLSGQADA